MKIKFLTYSTPEYEKAGFKLIQSAKNFGIKDVHHFKQKDFEKTKFYAENKKITTINSGAGCFIWKIYYINKVYNQLDEGDILFYADAGSKIIRDPKYLTEICLKKETLLFNLNNYPKNLNWCKKDTFYFMDCDYKKFHHGSQVNGAFQLYKKCKKNDILINEFFKYSVDIRIISNIPSTSSKQELKGFKEHRFAQCILSILAIKYDIDIFRDPTQWGNHMKTKKYRKKFEWLATDYEKVGMKNSNYPTIIFHHRNKIKFSLDRDFIKSKIS